MDPEKLNSEMLSIINAYDIRLELLDEKLKKMEQLVNKIGDEFVDISNMSGNYHRELDELKSVIENEKMIKNEILTFQSNVAKNVIESTKIIEIMNEKFAVDLKRYDCLLSDIDRRYAEIVMKKIETPIKKVTQKIENFEKIISSSRLSTTANQVRLQSIWWMAYLISIIMLLKMWSEFKYYIAIFKNNPLLFVGFIVSGFLLFYLISKFEKKQK